MIFLFRICILITTTYNNAIRTDIDRMNKLISWSLSADLDISPSATTRISNTTGIRYKYRLYGLFLIIICDSTC